ncbi:hypothetical protein [Micavibrio aeruginosavorus]|uniref:Transmembrane protein n=1 Tax=Micavibrio aeruginosavorus EPB TaxID=349215 RepID=M4VFL3_9BACT|nr:hypothetical protein [Micavibrio aeruginosavorus]AGH96846.1 hypothetical protein A11S_8 [Micavibrio aeruginosavorus EPB]
MDPVSLRRAFRFKAIGNFVLGVSASAAVMGLAHGVPPLMDHWSAAAQIQNFADRFSETHGTEADYRRVQARLEFEQEGPLHTSIGHCYAASTQDGTLHKWPLLACLGTAQEQQGQSSGLRGQITVLSTFVFAVGGLVGFAMAQGAGRVMRRELGPKPD